MKAERPPMKETWVQSWTNAVSFNRNCGVEKITALNGQQNLQKLLNSFHRIHRYKMRALCGSIFCRYSTQV